MLLPAAPVAAESVRFHVQFANDSAVVLEAVIRHSGGTEQKSRRVRPWKKETFEFGVQCRNEHRRKFEVVENQTNTTIGSGSFVMKTGRERGSLENECVYETFDLECDGDPIPDDSFELACQEIAKDKVKITIE
jgi:hypothetical protein